MKKINLLLTICAFFIKSINVSTYARSYIVLNYDTKEILEGNNYHLVRSVASISKIMTALVAIDNASLDEVITVNEEILKVDGSSIYLQIGESISLKDLLYGLLLRSGNDAATMIAVLVSSDVNSFVYLMNEKAKEIGMNNSHFNNPSGLDIDDEGNLSTAYDMALLMNEALNNSIFREIVSSKEYKSENHGTWINKNKLLRNYEYTTGGKTGFTTKARRTLVTSAKKDNVELIIVTLDCGNDFNFHKELYEKYFSLLKGISLLNKGNNYFDEYTLYCNKDINVYLKKDEINSSEIVYKIDDDVASIFLVNDNKKEIGSCFAKKNVKKNKTFINKLFNIFKSFF